jgi:hypothetical protein
MAQRRVPTKDELVLAGSRRPVTVLKNREEEDKLRAELKEPLSPATFDTPSSEGTAKSGQITEFEKWNGFDCYDPSELDFTMAFMIHANLYNLGQYTQINQLQDYSFRALQAVLKRANPKKPYSLAAEGFAVLTRHVYAHIDNSKNKEDRLKDLVLSYAAWNHEDLMADRTYQMLLREGGDFVPDLSMRLVRRMLPVNER